MGPNISADGVRSLKSWFKPLTREEIELERLLKFQDSRTRTEGSVELEKEVHRMNTQRIDLPISNDTSVADLVDDNSASAEKVIVIHDNDNVFKAFDKILNPEEMVLHSNIEPSITIARGKKRKRPDNWQTIAEYYMVNRSVRGTIKLFNLSHLNESVAHWTTTFGRWLKDHQANKSTFQYGRMPVYGTDIDNKLADVVREFNNNAVPITDSTLRLQLIALLQTYERQDILDRIAPNDSDVSKEKDLRFGNQWAHRFYVRHNFSTTTKMRDERSSADYEEPTTVMTELEAVAVTENIDVSPPTLIGGGSGNNNDNGGQETLTNLNVKIIGTDITSSDNEEESKFI